MGSKDLTLLIFLFFIVSFISIHLVLRTEEINPKSNESFKSFFLKNSFFSGNSKAFWRYYNIPLINNQKNSLDISSSTLSNNNSEDLSNSSKIYLKNNHPNKSLKISNNLRKSDSLTQKLHMVTYASHHGRDDRFCRAIESSIRNNFNITILGWDVTWVGLSQKLEAAYQYSLKIPDTDLMLFTDAFDILFLEDSSAIVEIFKKRNYNVLFSAECGCWPHFQDDRSACFTKYPNAPTPYRYLNSGAWIGKAQFVRKLLKDVIFEAGNEFSNANDQKLVADMFISGRNNISLDYKCEIFQSMHFTNPPGLPKCNPREDLELSNSNNWYNKRTGTFPAIFHFNGGGKKFHLPMEEKVWYKRPNFYKGSHYNQLRTHTISIPIKENPNRKINFENLCSSYLLSESKRFK